uniref:Ubiquitin carboxyl-terminal hydrolase n=1 Tax=Clastoptera arizonana TaxID=38151 RepID=A0A1B6DQX1_9HEMI
MAAQLSLRCVHSNNSEMVLQHDIELAKEQAKCHACDVKGPNLWLCLYKECLTVACGDNGTDHSLMHHKKLNNHCVHLNLSTLRIWCYLCDTEIFWESNASYTEQHQVPISCQFRHGDSIDDESDDSRSTIDDSNKPTGLTGLQNIGNTCYMNAALQALSNTPPLTQFFLSCGAGVLNTLEHNKKPPTLSRNFLRLMQELWHQKRAGYVAPTGILYGIRNAHPMFRGYYQHDTQEFLRCFMDQLHEELKVPLIEPPPPHNSRQPFHIRRVSSVDELSEEEVESSRSNMSNIIEAEGGGASSQSEGEEYETCDSGVSERSSLSDEGSSAEIKRNRSFSRSRSPTQDRLRSKLTSKSQNYLSTHASPTRGNHRRKTQVKYRSIISDVFDGKVLSSVQCLTCNRISTRIETFQDLSLPIPNRDHLNMLHQGSVNIAKCSQLYDIDQGWFTWLWDWVCSFFWGPTVGLHDCLAAFFSADELKGDNMYSCEKCNKLRNGVKYSKVLELPEVLCIHLKRFRHELMFSSKINNYVTFPLEGLDLRPYLHKDCVSQVTTYDLVSVICHHGAAGSGGHYTCYSLNGHSEQWYEFDDLCVTRVTPETVRNSEAYVLFYRKNGSSINQYRQRVGHLLQLSAEDPGIRYLLSKQWVNRFNTFSEPGPIDNTDFLCIHGQLIPERNNPNLMQLMTDVTAPVWDYLYEKFGGGPVCTLAQLTSCEICLIESYLKPEVQLREFTILAHDYQLTNGGQLYALATNWFGLWDSYVKGQTGEPPGPIDNSALAYIEGNITPGKDFIQVTSDQWGMLYRIYGGGPEVLVHPQPPASPKTRKKSHDHENNSEVWSNSNSVNNLHMPVNNQSGDFNPDLGPQESLNTKLELTSATVSLSDVRITTNEPIEQNHIPAEIC